MNNLIKSSIILLLAGAIGYGIAVSTGKIDGLAIIEKSIVTPVDYRLIDSEVGKAVKTARIKAIKQAEEELSSLHDDIMQKVDSNFLDWYFDYGNQMMMGLESAFTSLMQSDAEAKEELKQQIAEQFSNHVMPPALIQANVEQIAENSVNTFVKELSTGLEYIPEKYNLTSTQWDKYLNNISVIVGGVDGQTAQPISLKTLVVGATGITIAGGAMLAEMTLPIIETALAETALAETGIALGAAESVAVLEGSSLGGPLVFGIAAVGVGAWEYFDHQETVKENRPLLRNHIDQYLKTFEHDMLKPSGAIGATIHQLETAVIGGLRNE